MVASSLYAWVVLGRMKSNIKNNMQFRKNFLIFYPLILLSLERKCIIIKTDGDDSMSFSAKVPVFFAITFLVNTTTQKAAVIV